VWYCVTYQSLPEWPVHLSVWRTFPIPTLWSSLAELSRRAQFWGFSRERHQQAE